MCDEVLQSISRARCLSRPDKIRGEPCHSHLMYCKTRSKPTTETSNASLPRVIFTAEFRDLLTSNKWIERVLKAMRDVGVIKAMTLDSYPVFGFIRCENEIEKAFLAITRVLRWRLARLSRKEFDVIRRGGDTNHIDGEDTFGVAGNCVDDDNRSVYPTAGVIKMVRGKMRGLCGTLLGRRIYERSQKKLAVWRCIVGKGGEDPVDLAEMCALHIRVPVPRIHIPDEVFGLYVSLNDFIGDMEMDMLMTLVPHPDVMYCAQAENGFSITFETTRRSDTVEVGDLVLKGSTRASDMAVVFKMKTLNIPNMYDMIVKEPSTYLEPFLIANGVNPCKYIIGRDLHSPFQSVHVLLQFMSRLNFECPVRPEGYEDIDVAQIARDLDIKVVRRSVGCMNSVCERIIGDISSIFISTVPLVSHLRGKVEMDLYTMIHSIIHKKCSLIYRVFSMYHVFPKRTLDASVVV